MFFNSRLFTDNLTQKKMSEETQSQPSLLQQQQPQSSDKQPTVAAPRLNVHDIRNSDLVSRYMAATPPYLYSSHVGPHNFFFSDMLRSIVQNRNAEQASRSSGNQMNNSSSTAGSLPLGRRSRKRTWPNVRSQDTSKDAKYHHGFIGKMGAEKPLELTNKCHSPVMKLGKTPSELQMETLRGFNQSEISHTQQINAINNNNSIQMPQMETHSSLNSSTNTGNSSDLVLPPPPPMWYPPLYPPYGIDPLHFFIDLRVSGHIYDRKKENTSPNALDDDSVASTTAKPRLGSAFSVPPSRRDTKTPVSLALNLTATSPTESNTTAGDSAKISAGNNNIYDHQASFDQVVGLTTKNTNYVLQNLPRIYTDLSSSSQIGGADERNSVHSDETADTKSEDAGQVDRLREVVQQDVDRDENDSNDVVIVDSKYNNDSSLAY